MTYDIIPTREFEEALKALAKRNKAMKEDIACFIASLRENPMQGDELCPGIRKIRLAIKSKGRGKSGGARVITYTVLVTEETGQVFLLDIYDKSDYSTVDVAVLQKIVNEIERG